MTSMTLDSNKLKTIAHASHTATVTMTALALRERLRHNSDITRTKALLVRSGEKIIDEDYRKFWKDLEAAGAGSIIYGRNGKSDRFEWHYSLKNVAKVAIGDSKESLEKLNGKKKVAQVKPIQAKLSAKSSPKPSAKAKVYIPNLRNGFDVEISLPSDVTQAELRVIRNALDRF